MAFPKFQLRKHLYYIGQNMSTHDLNSLKFLCTYHGVPKRQLEKMETAFELFCALESQDKIGYGNDSILRDLLASRQREHLLNKYPLTPIDDLASDHGGLAPSPKDLTELSMFLVTISDSLSHRDFKDIACFLFDPDVSHYSYQDIENMESAMFIFEKLIELKIISPSNLTALYQVLEVIGRNDLCQRIVEYLPPGSHAAALRQKKLQGLSLPSSSFSSYNTPSTDTTSPNSIGYTSELVSPFSSRSQLGEEPPSRAISVDHGRIPSAPLPPTQPAQPEHQRDLVTYPQVHTRKTSNKVNHWVPKEGVVCPPPQGTPSQGHPHHAYNQATPPQAIPPQATPPQPFIPIQHQTRGTSPQQIMQESYMQQSPHVSPNQYATPTNFPPYQRVHDHSLLHQLQAENQELKDVAAQQFQLVQDLIHQVELAKRGGGPENGEAQLSEVPSYPMNKMPHGIAIVIGNEFFEKNKKRRTLVLGPRNGCQSDIYNFSSCFGHLQYGVRSYHNQSAQQILSIFDEVSKIDHSNYDSFVFCISTHGEDNNYIFGSDSERINIYQLIGQMQSCESLKGKPKLFFIQACRTMPSDTVSSDGSPPLRPALNQDADVAIFWATTRFSSAYRSPRDGSWFVATIHKVFTSRAHKTDLVNMMYLVTDVIANMEGTDKESREKARQCVEVNLQMRGTVRFLRM